MKKLQRLISLLLTLCLVISMVPARPIFVKAEETAEAVQASEAAEAAQAPEPAEVTETADAAAAVQEAQTEDSSVVEIRFYSDCTSDQYVVIGDSETTGGLNFAAGENPYKFEITMSDSEKIGNVYVIGTNFGNQMYLDAVYNETTGRFVTEGYFDESNETFAPREISVGYTPKIVAPEVGSAVDWELFREDALKAQVESTSTGSGSSSGTLDLSGSGGSLVDTAIDYVVTAMYDKTAPEINEIRDHYQTASKVLSYVIPGLDDSRYHAYLDMSDPETYKVFVDDGLDTASKAVELTMSAKHPDSAEYYKLSEVSDRISQVSTAVGVASDLYNINQDMDDLRQEAYSANHLDEKGRTAVLKDIDALEGDQTAYTLLAAVIPAAVAAGGMVAGPAATLFAGMIGIIGAASSLVFDHRIAGVREKTVSTDGGAGIDPEKTVLIDDNTYAYIRLVDKGKTLIYTTEHPENASYITMYDERRNKIEKVIYEEGMTGTYPLYGWVRSLSLPGSIKYLTDINFRQVGMSQVVIPQNVEYVADCIFDSVVLPTSVTYLSGNSWKSLHYQGNMDQWSKIKNSRDFDYFSDTNNIYMSPSGRVGDTNWWLDGRTLHFDGDADRTGDPWKYFSGGVYRVEIDEGTESIGGGVCQDMTLLSSVSLPETLTYIGVDTFAGCTHLENIDIPENCEYIGNGAFSGCTGLKSIIIPKNCEEIGSGAFSGCTSLKRIVIPENCMLGQEVFSGCTALEEVVIGHGITSLDEKIFADCTSLTSVTIPESVGAIYSNAFQNCTSLQTITIPKTVTWIAADAFSGCTNLKTIHFGSSPAVWKNMECADQEPAASAKVTYQSEGVCGESILNMVHQNYMFWDFREDTGCLTIQGKGWMDDFAVPGDGTEYYCPWQDYKDQIKSIVMEEGVHDLGENAFYGLSAVTEVSLPDTVEMISDSAFQNCTALKEITIPDRVHTIGKSAFYGCTSLTDVKFSSDLECIYSYAFADCTALTAAILPDTLERIDRSAFSGCSGLVQLDLPDALTSISQAVFNGCESLESVTIPASVESIGGAAFGMCTSLKKIFFEGDAPSLYTYNVFDSVTATCYYPLDNPTWTQEVLDSYDRPNLAPGGKLTWMKHCGDNHTPVKDPAVTATCYESGLTEGSHCSTCGMVLVAQQEIPASHKYETKPGKEATCTEYGYTDEVVCSVCKRLGKKRENILPLGHSFGDWVTEGSLTYRACTRCGYTENKVTTEAGQVEILAPQQGGLTFVVDPVDSSEGAYKTAQNAVNALPDQSREIQKVFDITLKNTSGEPVQPAEAVTVKLPLAKDQTGNFSVYRINNDKSLTDMAAVREGDFLVFETDHFSLYVITSAAGHTHSYQTAVTAPTCTAGGYTTYTCSCGDNYQADKVAALGHSYDDNVDGTCNRCSVNRETVETRQVTHMFRMYNPNTGEHFYTGSEEEKGNLVAVGWQYEGVGFTFPANTGAPVHRLFEPATGEHLYTMDEAEKASLMANGWNYEGIAFNSAYDTEAVQHRLHNPNATVGAYHFTFSEEERQNLINVGWEYQGIGWYSCWK